VKRVEVEQRIREVILTQRRRQAEVTKNSDEARRAQERARTELNVRTEERWFDAYHCHDDATHFLRLPLRRLLWS